MNHLEHLENKSIYILREAYSHFPKLAMLWSVGKDSTVMIRLAQKAFFGQVPFPLIHIDTGHKIPEMITFRDAFVLEQGLTMIVGQNKCALKQKNTFPDGNVTCVECCRLLKTTPLSGIIDGTLPRYRLNHQTQKYELDSNNDPFDGLILGIRGDEEGSRSKERYFSPRAKDNLWNLEEQPPEFWSQFNTEFPPKTHVRIHPLLDWTEKDIWHYIKKENIRITRLYFNQGNNQRYRSLGCGPCTHAIKSKATTVEDIIHELEKGALASIPERSGRAQDKEDRGGLETLRRDGYM